MEYCMCYSKELVLLDLKADFELQKTYLQIFIFIDVSCSDVEDGLEVTRLLTGRLVTELFVKERKDENLKLSGHGNEMRK